jgi:hypothetical protein
MALSPSSAKKLNTQCVPQRNLKLSLAQADFLVPPLHLTLVSKFPFGQPHQVSVLELALWFSMIFCDCEFTPMIPGKYFSFF